VAATEELSQLNGALPRALGNKFIEFFDQTKCKPPSLEKKRKLAPVRTNSIRNCEFPHNMIGRNCGRSKSALVHHCHLGHYWFTECTSQDFLGISKSFNFCPKCLLTDFKVLYEEVTTFVKGICSSTQICNFF